MADGAWVTLGLSALTGASVLLMLGMALPSGLLARPSVGERGYRRGVALRSSPLAGLAELLLRAVGQSLSRLPLVALRRALERRLEDAGRPWGLGADEFLALCLVSGALLAGMGGLSLGSAGTMVVSGLFGLALPLFRLDELMRQRRLTVSRSLPAVIDLIALSMEAGLDFGRAVHQVEGRLHLGSPLRFELEHLRHKLALGWARGAALEDMARRIPTGAVRQFVTAVVQGERRGTPLAEVLALQAQVMRTKRSQAAEQAASRAGVLILLPLLLIFAAVFVVLLGPFAVKFLRGGLM